MTRRSKAGTPPPVSAGKRAAGEAAAAEVQDGMRLGYGTGSTVAYFLEALAERAVEVVGVPTSPGTAERCRELGLGLVAPEDVETLDLCVDGADELTPDLTLTKGGGGALLREKVVATMSRRMLVIATPDKVVDRLGASFALPVEVVPFAVTPVSRWVRTLGADRVVIRDGRTDNGNLLLDCRFPGGIADPAALAADLSSLPGVAEHGLFVGLAHEAMLGGPEGTVERLVR